MTCRQTHTRRLMRSWTCLPTAAEHGSPWRPGSAHPIRGGAATPSGLAGRDCPELRAPAARRSLRIRDASRGATLSNAGWSWADPQGNFPTCTRQACGCGRDAVSAHLPPRKGTLPLGAGSFAVIRALIRFRRDEAEDAGATALAEQVGVSQPRVSQVLHRLRDLELVDGVRHGRWRPRREALLDRFLAEYPGPGGSESYLYGLDSPADISVRASDAIAPRNLIAVSADVGPDLIVPWRRPSIVILYARRPLDPTSLGLVEAQGKHDANVIVRIPEDTSIFTTPPTFTAELGGREVKLADPAQQIWDLQDLGGADRVEAAERLREWLLARP